MTVLVERNKVMVPIDVAEQYDAIMEKVAYYDRLQYVYKIKLNSSYGALTNYYFRFFRLDAGESTTGTGRAILRHQIRKVGEVLDGEYMFNPPVDVEQLERDVDGDYRILDMDEVDYSTVKFPSPSIVYGDTDSVAANSIVEWMVCGVHGVKRYTGTIETMWERMAALPKRPRIEVDGDREIIWFTDDDILVESLSVTEHGASWLPLKFIYRHKVQNKERWDVMGENGAAVSVTNDHSIMIVREGKMIQVKPCDIKRGDMMVVRNTRG